MKALAGVLVCARLLAGTAAEVARGISELTLDPAECYRVRDVTLTKEDARIYLTDGYLIFAKPVAGARVAAVFAAAPEGGDAEVLLLPPTKSERRSLAVYTGSPNLDEHFDTAVFVFSDDTWREATAQLKQNPLNARIKEMGGLLAERWTGTARNIAESFETRLVLDLLSHAGSGFFTAAIGGRKAGNFDVTFDPQAREQMVVGQVAYRDNRPYLDIWTSFEARSVRTGKLEPPPAPYTLSDYRIDATLQPDLTLEVVTRVKMKTARAGEFVLPFDISGQMRVSEARVDGEAAEVLASESLRSNLIRNNGNDQFLVVTARPLEAGREHEIEFHGSGKVIRDAGNRVYYVGARGNWYPRSALQFASYDLTFRYPKDLDLVSAGSVVSDRTEGEQRVTRRRTAAPILFAGFNLGAYERTRVTRAAYTVEVCANRQLEAALQPARMPEPAIMPPAPLRRRASVPVPQDMPMPPAAIHPASKLQELAAEIAGEMEFFSARFGPPPLRMLTVSPVPGTFGQGFPGLIYLSTLSYVAPSMPSLDAKQQVFFTELLHAHETAHQWWGNIVTAEGYHDAWLMEALANYSGLLYLEKRKGARTVEAILNDYRAALAHKMDGGAIEDSAGPIVMGARLQSSVTPDAWKRIVYGKGSWILHMLRRRMGDEKFLAMLAELRRRYAWKSITTEQFRALAAGYLPAKSADPKLEAFFDQWVYGTGIPQLKLTWAVKGAAPAVKLTGTVTQSEIGEDFSVRAPVEIQFAKGRAVTEWVTTSSEPATFQVTLKQAPAKVVLDPQGWVLKR